MTRIVSQPVGSIDNLNVDYDALAKHQNVVDYIFRLGLKNILQDAHASMTEKVEPNESARKAKKTAMSMKKLEALYQGEVAQMRAGSADPVEKEMRILAETDLLAQVKKLGKARKDYGKQWAALVDKMLGKNAIRYRATAERLVEERRAAAKETDELDIEDLLGIEGDESGEETDSE